MVHSRIMTWLSPPDFMGAYKRALRLRLEGTTSWISEEPLYQRWLSRELPVSPCRSKFGSKVLWIYGMAGSHSETHTLTSN